MLEEIREVLGAVPSDRLCFVAHQGYVSHVFQELNVADSLGKCHSEELGDHYGGSLENRARFPLQVVRAVRKEMPDSMPLFVRVSATEYVEGGWDIDECIELAKWFKGEGVDLIDCSSGGNSPDQVLKPFPGYQVQFASQIKKEAEIATGAVGLITEPMQAEEVLTNVEADVVLLGRALLRSPYWPIEARAQLDDEIGWPSQYLRGRELAQFAPPPRK